MAAALSKSSGLLEPVAPTPLGHDRQAQGTQSPNLLPDGGAGKAKSIPQGYARVPVPVREQVQDCWPG